MTLSIYWYIFFTFTWFILCIRWWIRCNVLKFCYPITFTIFNVVPRTFSNRKQIFFRRIVDLNVSRTHFHSCSRWLSVQWKLKYDANIISKWFKCAELQTSMVKIRFICWYMQSFEQYKRQSVKRLNEIYFVCIYIKRKQCANLPHNSLQLFYYYIRNVWRHYFWKTKQSNKSSADIHLWIVFSLRFHFT